MDFGALIAMLERHEGLRTLPYTDTSGKLTIGIGRNLTDCGISRDEALTLCANDIAECLDDLETFAWWTDLTDHRQMALLDMRFNLGSGGFRLFRNMIHALAVADYVGAAREMRNSVWAKEVGARADELATMMEHG